MARLFATIALLGLFSATNAAIVKPNNTTISSLAQTMVEKAMANMTVAKAFNVLEHKNSAPEGLATMVQKLIVKGNSSKKHVGRISKRSLRGDSKHTNLVADSQDPEEEDSSYGDGGVGAAEEMISEMITESQMTLDTEIERCTMFHNSMSRAIEEIRQTIAAANARSAAARAESLRANAQLEFIENKLPILARQLKKHKDQCEVDVEAINGQLDVVAGDLEVMEKILNMSACSEDEAAFLQTMPVKCCHHQGQVSFLMTKAAGNPLDALKSDVAKFLLATNFPTMVAAFTPTNAISFEQLDASSAAEYRLLGSSTQEDSLPNTPVTPVQTPTLCPAEAAQKCTVADSPACPRIQNKFMGLQADMRQKENDLKLELANTEDECKTVRENLEAQLNDLKNRKVEESTSLANAQGIIQRTSEQLRLLQFRLNRAEAAYKEQFGGCEILYGELKCEMDSEEGEEPGVCAQNIDAYTTEICGLKKIRMELQKVDGDDQVFMSDIIDCEVSEWSEQACTKTCGGGVLVKTRKVLVTPSNGATCPPLRVEEPCNIDPCPIDCTLNDWSRWSSCSASCGGGVRERQRTIDVHPAFDGVPCGELTESENCNMDSCDRDCTLAEWTEWCDCDKMCDGGLQKRMRGVAKEAYGEGQCFEEHDEERLEYQPCNTMSCESLLELTVQHPYVECDMKVDVIMILDGSGSLGTTGWEATKEFAATFAEAMHLGADGVEMAALLFSGPKYINDFYYCMGWMTPDSDWDMSTGCGMQWVQHLTPNMSEVVESVEGMEWPQGLTFTHVALDTSLHELSEGREDTPAVVIVVTDGAPTDLQSTFRAASNVRKSARLMFALVGSGTVSIIHDAEEMASEPYEHNVLHVTNFTSLTSPDTINHIISDFCPSLEREHCPYEMGPEGVACPFDDVNPRTGDCGSANQLYISENAARFTVAGSLEEAPYVCGSVCDGSDDCGGFNYRDGRCYFRKYVSTEDAACADAAEQTSNGATCFKRVTKECKAAVV